MNFKKWLIIHEASMFPKIVDDSVDIINKAIRDYFTNSGNRSDLIHDNHVFEDFTISVKDNKGQLKDVDVSLIITATDVDDYDTDDEYRNYKFPNYHDPKNPEHLYFIDSSNEEETTYEKEFEKYKNAPISLKPAHAKNLDDFQPTEGNKKNAVVKIYVDIHPKATSENINMRELAKNIFMKIKENIDEVIK